MKNIIESQYYYFVDAITIIDPITIRGHLTVGYFTVTYATSSTIMIIENNSSIPEDTIIMKGQQKTVISNSIKGPAIISVGEQGQIFIKEDIIVVGDNNDGELDQIY